MVRDSLATGIEVVEVTYGLEFTPIPKGIGADAQQVGFRTTREPKKRHG